MTYFSEFRLLIKLTANSIRDITFAAYEEDLESVHVLKYLGRMMAIDDNGIHAVCRVW